MNCNVEAILQYGRVWNKHQIKFFYISAVILSCCPLYTIISFIVYRNEIEKQLAFLIAACVLSVLFLLGVYACIIEIKKNKSLIKIIKKCSNDMNKVFGKATVRCLAMRRLGYQTINDVKIRVFFKYQGQEIIQDSKKYHKFFSKYIDKTVSILYSPLYNQVLFIKD